MLWSNAQMLNNDGVLKSLDKCVLGKKNDNLNPIWRDNNISLGSKVKLLRSLVIFIFLYACESCLLTAELEKITQAFQMRYYRRLWNIWKKDHVTR